MPHRNGQNISHITENNSEQYERQWSEQVTLGVHPGVEPRTTQFASHMRPATCVCCVEKSLALEGVRGGCCAQALITPFARLPKDFAARINTLSEEKRDFALHSQCGMNLLTAQTHACISHGALGTMPNEIKTVPVKLLISIKSCTRQIWCAKNVRLILVREVFLGVKIFARAC